MYLARLFCVYAFSMPHVRASVVCPTHTTHTHTHTLSPSHTYTIISLPSSHTLLLLALLLFGKRVHIAEI